jgi:hypothetical protein
MDTNTAFGKPSLPGQALQGGVLVAVYFLALFTIEVVYSASATGSQRFQPLVPDMISGEGRMVQIRQDASKYTDAKPIGQSVNERTGTEFGYSFFLFVEPSTFTGSSAYKHVFHKGYLEPWPLMGPGVFINGATNTMRVAMNTYKQPFTYVDIKNIPVDKWFHVVLNCYKGGLDVFINGFLANRLSFLDTVPYQNFGDIYVFSPQHSTQLRGPGIAALGESHFDLDGPMKGFLSRLIYTRYALSTAEIQAILNAGPSQKIDQKTMDKPPYLADNWWAQQ